MQTLHPIAAARRLRARPGGLSANISTLGVCYPLALAALVGLRLWQAPGAADLREAIAGLAMLAALWLIYAAAQLLSVGLGALLSLAALPRRAVGHVVEVFLRGGWVEPLTLALTALCVASVPAEHPPRYAVELALLLVLGVRLTLGLASAIGARRQAPCQPWQALLGGALVAGCACLAPLWITLWAMLLRLSPIE